MYTIRNLPESNEVLRKKCIKTNKVQILVCQHRVSTLKKHETVEQNHK